MVGAVVVTTPQQVSLADSRRAVRMYQKLNIPTLGIVENMSYYTCENCHHEADIFGHGGGEALALDMKAAVSRPAAGVSADPRRAATPACPLVVAEPASAAAKAFLTVAERAAAQVSIAAHAAAEKEQGEDPAHSRFA